ncbi:MAG: hypothetical protein M3525_09540 [Acidobacteriota bacterium]|nr:hypothetical protein [Acidobacteriota bacterium]
MSFVKERNLNNYVKINNKPSIDGQIIVSPSIIEVPVNTELLVDLGNTALLRMGPDTEMNLAFDETKITGFLSRGSLTVKVPPNNHLSIQTNDGVVSTPNQNQENVVTIGFVNGKTQVKTIGGLASLNKVLIASGETFTAGDSTVKDVILTPRSSIYSYLIIPAATILFNLFKSSQPTDRSNFGAEQTNVGPMK